MVSDRSAGTVINLRWRLTTHRKKCKVRTLFSLLELLVRITNVFRVKTVEDEMATKQTHFTGNVSKN